MFPLLSQCLLLQALCAESDAVKMPGFLGGKLDAFLASCLLRRWSDALDVLRATARYAFMPATAPSSASSSSGASWWLPNVAKRPSAWTGWSRWRP